MNTRELLTYLGPKCNETPTVLLQFINEQLKFIYGKPLRQTLYYDPATGLPPYLQTTDPNLRYTFPDGTYVGANVLKTIEVLTLGSSTHTGLSRAGSLLRRSSYNINNTSMYVVPVTSITATFDNPAELTFIDENPGTTTDVYYHLFCKKPADISSPNINLPIPESQHLRFAHGIIALYKNEKYGDMSAFEYWEQRICPMIWAEMNSGAQGQPMQTPLPPEHREYWYAG